jgi:hypothetical protein
MNWHVLNDWTWITPDKSRLANISDKAKILLGEPGTMVPEPLAIRLGLAVPSAVKGLDPVEDKAIEPENKSIEAPVKRKRGRPKKVAA